MENEVKEPAPKYNYISPEEYLEMERASENKNEYYHGQMLAMSGASLNHNNIDRNLISAIDTFLEGKPCEILPSHMRVGTPSHDSYMYPDASIVCGDPELEDDKFDTLTNPSVIFEILSPSTGSIDKGRKFFFYQAIPSLQEYIMIDPVKKFIQIARKHPDNSWQIEILDEKNDSLFIRTINYHLSFEKIYRGTSL
ncbi:MAG: Uma2 family endonuclease [Chitinophagaceae bacterium]